LIDYGYDPTTTDLSTENKE